MKIKMLLAIIFISVVFSCSLRRNNPLDPTNSGIKAPTVVQNIQVTRVNSFTSAIEWDAHVDEADSIDVDGYYIYRTFHYNGLFELRTTRSIGDTMFIDNTADYDSEHGIWSYYQMSAFKIIPEADSMKLEGTRSAIHYHGDGSGDDN